MELTTQTGQLLPVSDRVFAADYNEALVHQVVTAYLAGGRAGTKKQKTKGEVSGGGKKPWKQKGTGQARAGSIRSPLWRGGGKTHAALPRDHSQKVNRKMYRGAIRCILSELNRRGSLVVVDEFTLDQPKTQLLLGKVHALCGPNALIVSEQVSEALALGSRNIPHVSVSDVHGLTPVSLLWHEKVVVTAEAVKVIDGWLA